MKVNLAILVTHTGRGSVISSMSPRWAGAQRDSGALVISGPSCRRATYPDIGAKFAAKHCNGRTLIAANYPVKSQTSEKGLAGSGTRGEMVSINPVERVLGYCLAMVCVGLLAGVLYAGLHPFHVPANEVKWIGSVNGLRFGEHASIRSARPFPAPEHGDRTIEFWIQPGIIDDSNTILAFDSPSSPRGLAFSQAESDLEIRIESSSAWRHEKSSSMSTMLSVMAGQHSGQSSSGLSAQKSTGTVGSFGGHN
jgi:hypothetical protein